MTPQGRTTAEMQRPLKTTSEPIILWSKLLHQSRFSPSSLLGTLYPITYRTHYPFNPGIHKGWISVKPEELFSLTLMMSQRKNMIFLEAFLFQELVYQAPMEERAWSSKASFGSQLNYTFLSKLDCTLNSFRKATKSIADSMFWSSGDILQAFFLNCCSKMVSSPCTYFRRVYWLHRKTPLLFLNSG